MSRIIPARAGFTCAQGRSGSGKPDHPRSRGVYSATCMIGGIRRGSSPLARGLLGEGREESLPCRIIPARAGFTTSVSSQPRSTRDHPRSRGVYVTNVLAPALVAGSSPLARGLLEDMDMSENTDRIIPARAGFTGGCDDEAEAV